MRLSVPFHRGLLAAVIAATLAAAPVAGATDASPAATGTQVFAADWFADASPHDAGDMVRRLPGFTIVDGDEDVRGYAGALGNVLVDGARPASKRDDIDDVGARIPASTVERIELIRGGAGGHRGWAHE